MKVKKGFMLREVANNFVVVPVGKAAIDFNGIITLNETGAYLWEQLLEDIAFDDLVLALTNKYEVSGDVATFDVQAFVFELNKANLLE